MFFVFFYFQDWNRLASSPMQILNSGCTVLPNAKVLVLGFFYSAYQKTAAIFDIKQVKSYIIFFKAGHHGLIHHVLDWEGEGSNLTASRSHRFNFFNAGFHQFLSDERRWKAEE